MSETLEILERVMYPKLIYIEMTEAKKGSEIIIL
jgi:hypothetical protein